MVGVSEVFTCQSWRNVGVCLRKQIPLEKFKCEEGSNPYLVPQKRKLEKLSKLFGARYMGITTHG